VRLAKTFAGEEVQEVVFRQPEMEQESKPETEVEEKQLIVESKIRQRKKQRQLAKSQNMGYVTIDPRDIRDIMETYGGSFCCSL